MTKKTNQLISLTLHNLRLKNVLVDISQKSFSNKKSSCGKASKLSSLWFCFGLWSACKITRIQFQRIFFKLHFWGFLLVVQIRDQLVQAMRNSDPRLRIVFVHGHNSDLNSIFTLQNNKLQLSIRAQFGCSLWSNLSVQMFLHLLAKSTHDQPLRLWIVRILQYLSSYNTVRFQQYSGIKHPYKICSICLVVITFQFVLRIFATEDLCEHNHHYSKTRLSWSRLAQMKNSTVLPQRVSPFYHERFIFFTHFCDFSVKTELICRRNCAKNSCNRVLVGTIVDRQFSTAFALELTSGQWTCGSEDWVSAFCECHHHLFCHFVPFTLWTTDRIPLVLWTKTEKWPLSCSKSSCK